MTLADLAKLLVGAIIGFIGEFFTRCPLDKLAERRALLKSMGDRYIANTQANSNQQGDEFWRPGMLQNGGAAELSACELSRVCRRIVAHGLQSLRDREISTVFKDRRHSVRGLLRWASQESIDLSDGSTVLRRHAEEVDAQSSNKAWSRSRRAGRCVISLFGIKQLLIIVRLTPAIGG
jgi:hypothetical protein